MDKSPACDVNMLCINGAENSTLGVICFSYGLKQPWIRPLILDGQRNVGLSLSYLTLSYLILIFDWFNFDPGNFIGWRFQIFWRILCAAAWCALLANNLKNRIITVAERRIQQVCIHLFFPILAAYRKTYPFKNVRPARIYPYFSLIC
jgi:hypothetical protein